MSGIGIGRRGYTLLATATASRLADNAAAIALVLLIIGLLTARELVLGLAAGQLLAALPLLVSYGPVPVVPNEQLVPAQDAR